MASNIQVVKPHEFENALIDIFDSLAETNDGETPVSVNATITYLKPVKMRSGTRASALNPNPQPNPLRDENVTKAILGKYELCNETYTDRQTRLSGETYEPKGKGIIDQWNIVGVLGYNSNQDADYLCVYTIPDSPQPTVIYYIDNRKATPEEIEIIKSYEYAGDDERNVFYYRVDRIESIKIKGMDYRIVE